MDMKKSVLVFILLSLTFSAFSKTKVSFSGEITKDSIASLERRIAKAAHKIKPGKAREIVISLDSGGGDLQAANKFIKTAKTLSVTHDVKINTQVSWGSCDSACTVLFTAGEERIASRRASFGFHTPDIKSKIPKHMSREEILTMARQLWINAIARVDFQVASMIESKGYLFDEDFSYLDADELDTGYVTILE